jgi:hypothetical protein
MPQPAYFPAGLRQAGGTPTLLALRLTIQWKPNEQFFFSLSNFRFQVQQSLFATEKAVQGTKNCGLLW